MRKPVETDTHDLHLNMYWKQDMCTNGVIGKSTVVLCVGMDILLRYLIPCMCHISERSG